MKSVREQLEAIVRKFEGDPFCQNTVFAIGAEIQLFSLRPENRFVPPPAAVASPETAQVLLVSGDLKLPIQLRQPSPEEKLPFTVEELRTAAVESLRAMGVKYLADAPVDVFARRFKELVPRSENVKITLETKTMGRVLVDGTEFTIWWGAL